MKTLVAGWFSFELAGATAGDLMARDLACEWLEQARQPFDVAHAPPFMGGVDWRTVDPQSYSQIVFVCGPFGVGPPVDEFLQRFAGCRFAGLNLTMLQPLEDANPFDLLWERDSSAAARPDITFLAREPHVPVVGLVLIHPQSEYPGRDLHQAANDALLRLTASRPMAVVPIDTRLDENATGLRTAAEVESLIARTDVVLTTRLHGTVLALKNGVPVIAIDPVKGGAKILQQAATVGWPLAFTTDGATAAKLEEAFDYCLTESARVKARACADHARKAVACTRAEFIAAVSAPTSDKSQGAWHATAFD